MRKFVLSVLVSIIMAIGLVSARPLVINASTTGTQISYTNNTSYTGNIWCYREQLSAYVPTNASNYQYSLYFQTDPGLYGFIQGYVGDTNELFSVAVQNGISEPFYSTSTSAPTLNFVRLIEYNQTLPQEVIDYIKNIDENVELTNELLDKLLLYRQWNIPVESFGFIKYMDSYGFTYHEFQQYSNYQFPIFEIPLGRQFYNCYLSKGQEYIFIMGSNIQSSANPSVIRSTFGIDSNIDILNYKTINISYNYNQGYNSYFYIHSFTIKNNTNSGITVTLSANEKAMLIFPVYANFTDYTQYISTDFALRFGLSNQLLDDLHIVAQGTQQSNNSSSNLEDSADEYGELADDVLGLEDDLGSGFSSSLNNVPTTFNFSTQFGNKFLHSATWVRNQFETLTTNTPFGALITFSLVLGLALLLVGRRLL